MYGKPLSFVSLAALCLGLTTGLAAQRYQIISFKTKQLEKRFYCEGASYGDLNHDGHNDLISGPFWYEGPGFEKRHRFYQHKPFNPQGYSNNFFVFVEDFDKDGWNDILVIGFPGQDASWFENPKKPTDAMWKRHKVFDVVDNESPTFTDITGDGKPELVCQTGGSMGYATVDWSKPQAPWKFHPISKPDVGARFTHGLGVGDVDGDGKKDILYKHGWWKQPASLDGDPLWQKFRFQFADRGGAQMYVYDVDGDGENDVITSANAHGYGLDWFEQVRDGGKITFKRHRIMGSAKEDSRYGLVIGNLHAVDLIDINGDGLRDIVTGNRYWAHGGNAKADREPAALYWFELKRTRPGETAYFIPHEISPDGGVGTQVVAGDINGDGWPDVVVGNKKGTFVHIQSRKKVNRQAHFNYQRHEILKMRNAGRINREGPVPVGLDGKKLNLDFETGTLADWTATGDAFNGLPVKGDTVFKRRTDYKSSHAGDWWIGTFEVERSDRPTGTLTSKPFEVTYPWASFLIAGGRRNNTRVELVRADTNKVVFKASGREQENLLPVVVDLKDQLGKQIYIRIVDEATGGWGHINFDDFRFHKVNPTSDGAVGVLSDEQEEGLLPSEAAKHMRVPEGFHVDLVAGEPDIHQPIGFAIDEQGRIWVAEAYSYPVRRPDKEAKDRIVVFEDSNGDGKFDKRTVFEDDLNLISGIEVGFGGVWVGAAPYFMFIPDRNNDLVPDGKPEILLDGWAYQDTHETLNAFMWGPDGWLYGCHGVFTYSNVGKPGTPRSERVPINAGVWRYHPTRHEFEVFAWGTSNPWGVDFDDHGQAFITACVIPHLYHIIQGGRFRRQAGRHFNPYVYADIPTIADHLHYLGTNSHAGNGVSESVGGGHAHCGAMVYLGNTFPQKYRGAIFMNNIHGNRVNMDLLEPSGSGFIGRHGDDFLLANDKWFRGINLKYGPDGQVYLIDWYDKQACHRREPEIWDRTNGRLYKISYGDKSLARVDLRSKSDQELVALMTNDNDYYVRKARRLLQERGPNPAVHAALRKQFAEQTSSAKQLRSLWALHVTGGLDREFAMSALSHKEPYVRAWTIQLALETRKPWAQLLDRLATMAVKDESPIVRLYLASALQRLPLADRWPIATGLVEHGEDVEDHNIPLMLWYGIEPLVPSDPGRALGLAKICRIPRVTEFIFRRLAASGDAGLDALCGHLIGTGDDATREQVLAEIQTALRGQRNVKMPGTWERLYTSLEASRSQRVREAAMSLAVTFGDERVLPDLRGLLADKSKPTKRREWALSNLLTKKDAALPPILLGLLDDPELRGKAISALASFNDERTPGALIARFAKFNPPEQTAAVQTLISRAPFAVKMLEAVADKRLPKTILDLATTRRQLRQLKSDKIGGLVEATWGRFAPMAADVAAELARYKKKLSKDVLAKADLPHGRAVFARTCMACHTLYGQGADIGPDITGSGRSDIDYLLTNILDPSGEVAKEYTMTMVELEDGGFFAGIVTDKNDKTMTMRNQTETKIIPLSDIAKKENGKPAIDTFPDSLMPVGQLTALKDDEIRDLIGYLQTKKQVPMLAAKDNVHLLFNGRNLDFWDYDPKIWHVEDGEIVGSTKTGLKHNDFAKSHLLLGDFRLTLEVKLVGNEGNSGIQFRSKPAAGGEMKGYQADVGKGWWGKLYEEQGRALLWAKSGERYVKPGEWNTYEILAVGSRIRTAINGKLCVDLDDPKGERHGIIGLQVHSGGPTEVRFRKLKLEIDPEPKLTTVE